MYEERPRERTHSPCRVLSAPGRSLFGFVRTAFKTILNSLKETITVTSEDGVTEFVFTLTLAE